MNIHIGNLSPDTTEEELIKLFSQFGKVKSVKMFECPDLPKGYGFIDKSISYSEIQKLKIKNIEEKKKY